jgi:hypothetical protein
MLQKPSVKLWFGDDELDLLLEDASSTPSVSTGRELMSGTVTFGVLAGAASARVEGFLKAAAIGATPLVGDYDGIGRKFNVSTWSSSAQAGASHVQYRVELGEVEELPTPTLLIMNGIETQPYKYEERAEGTGVSIEARVKVSPEIATQLWDLSVGEKPNYFPVVRRGISDAPRQMRFGTCLWSEHDDGVKYELVLVEQALDEAKDSNAFRMLIGPLSNVMNMASETDALLDALLKSLSAAGTVSGAQVDAVRAAARERNSDRLRELFRLRDIDG